MQYNNTFAFPQELSNDTNISIWTIETLQVMGGKRAVKAQLDKNVA